MATEILINDGGAPARILPYTVKSTDTITAGAACSIAADGTVQLANSADTGGQGFAYAGIALTNAAAGEICSLITGVGVILNINVADLVPGQLIAATNATTVPKAQAVCLEDTTLAGLHKCQTL